MKNIKVLNAIRPVLAAIILISLILSSHSCGVNRQANAMKTLRQCKFEWVGADRIHLAGTDVLTLLKDDAINVASLPGIAFGLLRGEMPLNATLKLQVTNPTKRLAGVNQFQYEILMDGEPALTGVSTLPFEVQPGVTDTVLIGINTDVYPLISHRENLQKIMHVLQPENADTQSSSDRNRDQGFRLTLRIKPTLSLGNNQMNYPGYITMERYIDHKVLNRLR